MVKGEKDVPMKERQDRFSDKDQVSQAQTKGKRVEKVDDQVRSGMGARAGAACQWSSL